MSDRPTRAVSRAGFGRQGYCKLCSFIDEPLLNERIKAGWKAPQIIAWLRDHYQVGVNRKTIYEHQRHVMHPQDRLVTAVARTQARVATTKPASSTEQFLEAVRDAGYQRAIDNPEEVTIDHALKAASILSSQKQSAGNVTLILAKVFTGGERPYETIEGTAVEVAP